MNYREGSGEDGRLQGSDVARGGRAIAFDCRIERLLLHAGRIDGGARAQFSTQVPQIVRPNPPLLEYGIHGINSGVAVGGGRRLSSGRRKKLRGGDDGNCYNHDGVQPGAVLHQANSTWHRLPLHLQNNSVKERERICLSEGERSAFSDALALKPEAAAAARRSWFADEAEDGGRLRETAKLKTADSARRWLSGLRQPPLTATAPALSDRLRHWPPPSHCETTSAIGHHHSLSVRHSATLSATAPQSRQPPPATAPQSRQPPSSRVRRLQLRRFSQPAAVFSFVGKPAPSRRRRRFRFQSQRIRCPSTPLAASSPSSVV
nr:hypothetical protein Iba_chr01dCG5600 [Ipomoea batatas]